MSTEVTAAPGKGECIYDDAECTLLAALEADSSLLEAGRLRERLNALDELDAGFGNFELENSTACTPPEIRERAKALQGRLEAANAELYRCVRAEIVRGRPRVLLDWLQNSAMGNELRNPLRGLGFDFRDEFVSGVLQLREPGEPELRRSMEMVRYQPTPVRHILDLIGAAAISGGDIFVDLGSGLGHVPLLVSAATGARSVGIEVEAGYVASAAECADSLRLDGVEFIAQDAREADVSRGSVFYLYSPFRGSILTDVLDALRRESVRRPIKICSLGPCTCAIAGETWLRGGAICDTGRIAVFDSR